MILAACACGAACTADAPAAPPAPSPATPPTTAALDDGVPRGPHAVGWRALDVRDDTRRVRPGRDGAPAGAVRTLAVQLWYPAKPGGPPVTYLDYAGGNRAARVADLTALGRADGAAALATRERPARKAAARVDGSFPLAIWIGGASGPRAVAPLAEALASHGWVVAAFPDRGRQAEVELSDDELAAVETRARDVETVAAALAREPGIDARRPALIGFSSTMPSAILYDIRDRAGALVSLDGWEGSLLGARSLARITDADPRQMRAPYLGLCSRDPARDRDTWFLDAAVHASRTIVDLPAEHFDLVPLRAAAGGDPAAYRAAAPLVIGFLDHQLRQGAAPPLPAGATTSPAAPAPVDRVDVARALFERDDAAAAVRLLGELALSENELNDLGYQVLRRGSADAAIAIFRHVTQRFPASGNAWDSLGEAQLAAGQRDAAIASYRTALERNPNQGSAAAALGALGITVPAAAAPVDYRLVLHPTGAAPRVTSAELAPDRTIEIHHGPAGGPVLVVLDGVGAPIRTWTGYREWARLLIAAGVNVVLYDGATVADAEAALAYVHGHASALGLDDRRLCIFASSANGRVGVRLPLRPAGKAIACAVYYYPVLDVPLVRRDMPALVVRTGIDAPALLRTIDTWVAAAVAANAPVEVINLPDHRHGFDARDDNDASRRVIRETIAFIVRQLRPGAR
jgi:tetratricopeptide (TPR) repeat protein